VASKAATVAVRAALAAAVVAWVAMALFQAWRDAPTYDEAIYLSSGLSTLVHHQFRINVEHPPLAKVLAAAPALAAHPVVPRDDAFTAGDQFTYTGEVMAAAERSGRLQRLMFLGRLDPIAVTLATGWLLYLIGGRLGGRRAGLVAAGLWLSLPPTLGLGHLLSIDMAATATIVFGGWAVLRAFEQPRVRRIVVVGVAGGLTLLVRSSGLVVVPLWAAAVSYAVWRDRGERSSGGRSSGVRAIGAGALVLATGWALVWVGIRAVAPSTPGLPTAEALRALSPQARAVPLTGHVLGSIGWPAEYGTGLRYLSRVSVPAPGYLLGRQWVGNKWWFWPATAVVKLPASTIVLLAMAAGVGVAGAVRVVRGSPRAGDAAGSGGRGDGGRGGDAAGGGARGDRGRGDGMARLAALGLPALVVAGLAVVSPRQLGIRLLLTPLALSFALAAPILARLLTRSGPWRVLLGGLAVVQVASLASAASTALAWTSPPFHPGYRIAADSNVDWGQDFYRLRAWASSHPGALVSYFGPAGLQSTLAGTEDLLSRLPPAASGGPNPGGPPAPSGWIAVSASELTAYRAGPLSWLRAYCPVEVLGDATLVYRLAEPADLRPGPPRPAAVCHAAFSTRP
jgi:hypothetical protein